MHIHAECFTYKDTLISNRLRDLRAITRDGHGSKIGGDLIYHRLGTNGNVLSFRIIYLQLIVTRPLSHIFNTVFETTEKSWEV